MQDRRVRIVIAGASVVVICAVASLFYGLPSWVLPNVAFLSALGVTAFWGPTGRRIVGFILIILLCGYLGREIAGWQYLQTHGIMLPYSNEAFDRRMREQSQVLEIGTRLGVLGGVVIALAQFWLRRSSIGPKIDVRDYRSRQP